MPPIDQEYIFQNMRDRRMLALSRGNLFKFQGKGGIRRNSSQSAQDGGIQASSSDVTYSSVNIAASVSEIHTIYLVVLSEGATEPTAEQIEAGTDSSDTTAIFSNNAVGTSVTIPVIELLPSTAYDIFLAGKDSAGNYTSVVKVDVTTSAFDILSVTGGYLYVHGDDYNDTTDQWANRITSAISTLQQTGARNTPTKLAADLNGHDVVNFVAASNQLLESDVAWESASTDCTLYIVCKFDIYQSGIIFSNYDTGSAYVSTGFGIVSRTTGLRGLIRNSTGGVTSFDPALTDTASYHILCIKSRDLGNGASELLVKVDGQIAMISGSPAHNLLANPMTAATNKVRVGSSWDNVSFDGKIAAILACTERHGFVDERNVFNFLKTEFGLSSYTLQRDTDFTGMVSIDSTTGKEFNGLTYLRRSDNKYDLFSATIQGDIHRFTQTAVDTFTRSLIASGVGEMQSLEYQELNGTGYLWAAHKVLDKISVRLSDSPFTAADIVTGINEPQDIYLYDIDGDGVDEVFCAYQGTDVNDGGIVVIDYDGGDVLDSGSYTVTYFDHPAGWWIAGIFEFGGSTILAFSARNNGVNANEVPGHYYVTITNPGTSSWAFGSETTMSNTVRDWLHLRTGDVLGNGNIDLIGIANTTNAMLVHSGADLTTESTIALPESKPAFNIQAIGDLYSDGRSALLLVTQLSSGAGHYWLGRWNGSTYFWIALKETNNHPGDNEIISLDVYNEGKVRILIDDSENVVDGHVYIAGIL